MISKEKGHDLLVSLWRKYKNGTINVDTMRALTFEVIEESDMSPIDFVAIMMETKYAEAGPHQADLPEPQA